MFIERIIIVRNIDLQDLRPGMPLAQKLVDEYGYVLELENTPISTKSFTELVSYNYKSVSISDGLNINSVNGIPYTLVDGILKSLDSFVRNKDIIMLCVHAEQLRKYLMAHSSLLIDAASNVLTENSTHMHSLNVAVYSYLLGIKLGLSEQELSDLTLAALLHDIGKEFIPNDVLFKREKLTDKEMHMIKRHPLVGYKFSKPIDGLSLDIKKAILQHHERLDGSGYPYKLKSDAITYFAKIIAICDTFDALTSKRCYKLGHSVSEAFGIMSKEADKIDQDIVRELKEITALYPTGTMLKLGNGGYATVIAQTNNVDEPVIKLI